MNSQANTVTNIALAGAPIGTWRIDPAHSSVAFSVRHLMTRVRGRFNEIDGRVVVGEGLASCAVSASIATASVDTGTGMRDEDLRSARFFDAAAHPAMRFESTRVAGDGLDLEVVGGLTIRGVTRPVTIATEFLGLDEKGLQGEPRLGFTGRTTVRRSDFGIGEASVEGSRMVVGDAVTVDLDIQAFLEE